MDRRWLAVLVVAVVAVASGIWFGRGVTVSTAPGADGRPTDLAAILSTTTSHTPTIVVHVSGWVTAPGLVRVGEGSRVGDAIAAAGGTRSGAVVGALNLAAPLSDGQQVVVPGPGTTVEVSASGRGGAADGVVHLNTATAADLETLPGVGPVLAERIIAHREQRGSFQTAEDLLEVPGIGEAKLASMRDLIAIP